MKVCAIIQARMGSNRLPGKVLADIQGHPMLWYVVQRTRAAQTLDDVIVATTSGPADDEIVAVCGDLGVTCFRGSEEDVLDRYYQAALQLKAEVIVRITSDCPLIDPEIIDKVVGKFLSGSFDYASNSRVQTYPRGLDTEVMSFHALKRAWHEARKPYQRAHVTAYIYENPNNFRILSVSGEADYSKYRWTVDTAEDLELIQAIYGSLKGQRSYLNDVLKLMEEKPDLAKINGAVVQKALQEG